MMAFEHIIQAETVASNAADIAARRLALIGELRHVADLLKRDDPLAADAASLLLDGVLSRLGREWFALRGLDLPAADHLLAELQRQERHAAPFLWRLRLALRAPDPHARLVQCWELLSCIHEIADEIADDEHNNDVV
jgi:hypothetical protein